VNYSYDRTRTAAALPSLRELKLRWIVELAEAMATRFKTVGGWRDFGMVTEINRDSTRIKVHEEEPPQKAVEDVSLFFSKSLNKLRAAE